MRRSTLLLACAVLGALSAPPAATAGGVCVAFRTPKGYLSHCTDIGEPTTCQDQLVPVPMTGGGVWVLVCFPTPRNGGGQANTAR